MGVVISTLTGGFGNQLFQYAVGFAVAKANDSSLRLDLRHYQPPHPPGPPRPLQLGRLRAQVEPIRLIDKVRLSFSFHNYREIRGSRWMRKKPLRWLPLPRFRRFDDTGTFNPNVLEVTPGDVYLTGVWQTERYFAAVRNELLEQFQFRQQPDAANREMLDRIAEKTAVSVHIRRGDYLHPDTLTRPCSIDYYERAFAWMAERVTDANYFIFSDDPDWVKANLKAPAGSRYVTHNVGKNDTEDLRLMSHCNHFIIANSSFSWWGAWLSPSPGKQVVAPTRWYPQGHQSETDLVPQSWTRL